MNALILQTRISNTQPLSQKRDLPKEGPSPIPLKSLAHFAVAAVLAFGAFFFTWAWFVSGQFCFESPCSFNPNLANTSFVSLGFYCAFLVSAESVIGWKSRGIGNFTKESPRQHKFRMVGIWLMVIGALIAFAGFYDLNNTLVSCPAGGCSASALMSIYGPMYGMFYAGMILVALGDVLIMKTKFMKTPAMRIQTEKLAQ